MAAAYPSGYNTFVPQFDASGHLVVNFSRDPKSFAINNYTTLTPVKKSIGYYLEITREEAARVLSADLKQYHWPDGNDAPTGIWSGESFEFKAFETKRYAFPFMLGYKAQEQADWKILASHAAIYAQQAMTARTMKVAALACNSSNYGSNTSSASSLAGGKLDVAAVSTPYIRKAITAAAQAIHLATLGVVQPSDLCIVIGPEAARKLAATEEIHGYVKESATAIQVLNGEQLAIRNGKWGLPDKLYGFNLYVEDAVKITQRKGDTAVPAYVWDNDVMAILSRPGGLTSAEGSVSFSSIHIFSYEEMTVETKDDPDNRRTHSRLVEDYDVRMVSPASSFLITDILT